MKWVAFNRKIAEINPTEFHEQKKHRERFEAVSRGEPTETRFNFTSVDFFAHREGANEVPQLLGRGFVWVEKEAKRTSGRRTNDIRKTQLNDLKFGGS